jgi:CDGSH-type Zn-finger protein/uncharacterized Fe-S cluster protein YjdI
MKLRPRAYTGEEIDVTYDIKRCIHAEECIKRMPAVFDLKKRPWIQPNNGDVDTLAEVITHCPTGALHYERKDGGAAEATPDTNSITLDEDGPVYLRGQITLKNTSGDVILEDTRVAMCRCGASNNKPLCDNEHLKIDFQASTTVGDEDSADIAEATGELVLEPSLNGPMHVTGNFEILGPDGSTLYRGNDTWLCRCGGSSNKPFCDNTHRTNGFEG